MCCYVSVWKHNQSCLCHYTVQAWSVVDYKPLTLVRGIIEVLSLPCLPCLPCLLPYITQTWRVKLGWLATGESYHCHSSAPAEFSSPLLSSNVSINWQWNLSDKCGISNTKRRRIYCYPWMISIKIICVDIFRFVWNSIFDFHTVYVNFNSYLYKIQHWQLTLCGVSLPASLI